MLKKFKNLVNKRVISKFSQLSKGQQIYVDNMYNEWKKEPSSVNPRWQSYFTNMKNIQPVKTDNEFTDSERNKKNIIIRINRIIKNYRVYGYNIADIDPLKNIKNQEWFTDVNTFDKEIENFTEEELDTKIKYESKLQGFHNEREEWTAREIIKRIREIYLGKIAFDYMQIPNRPICNWIRKRIETKENYKIKKDHKLKILDRLLEAETFNKYFHEIYPNKKRYGTEGIDSFITGMGHAIEVAQRKDFKQVVIGMANRGRLNILGCVARKPFRDIFSEYEETNPDVLFSKGGIYEYSGDIAYHQGSSNKLRSPEGKEIIVSTFPNPCHKECINPVVLGSVKARLSRKSQENPNTILPILIHGDSALSGRGVNFETQQLESLDKYSVGGTVHLVLNNQIGSTTETSQYNSPVGCTNISNINENFVIHVNAENVELVDWAIETAIEYRNQWNRDVFVNIIGYRRFGQHDLDDPFITHPLLYSKISQMKSIPDLYSDKLISEGIISKESIANIKEEFNIKLRKEYEISKTGDFKTTDIYLDYHKNFISSSDLKTAVKKDQLKNIGKKINKLPGENFSVNPLVKKVYSERLKAIEEEGLIDWGSGELLAYGTLLNQGYGIRLTGEDVERGTFTHRHAVMSDQKTNESYLALGNLLKEENQNLLTINNSCLSEYATMGFEYGFSISSPQFLTLWEAQFGDFANGAQVIIDQFIASGEKKWGRMSGLVLLLPHGYDGQGPEHSNARIERFLASVSDDYHTAKEDKKYRKALNYKTNMTVCNVTQASNYFHLLRKQLLRNFRKPLVLMVSKKLLRNKMTSSPFNEFIEPNKFQKLLDDNIVNKKNAKKIIFCSGQVYLNVLERREELKLNEEVAIIRLEQIAPFPYIECAKILEDYNKNAEILWVQEEAYNYGAFTYVRPRVNILLEENGFNKINYRGRRIQAATSTGYPNVHKKEIEKFLKATFK